MTEEDFIDRVNQLLKRQNFQGKLETTFKVTVFYPGKGFRKKSFVTDDAFTIFEMYKGKRKGFIFKAHTPHGDVASAGGHVEFTEDEAKKYLTGFKQWWTDSVLADFENSIESVKERQEQKEAELERQHQQYGEIFGSW